MQPRVLVTPRNVENPYLSLLSESVREQGESIDFFDFRLTSSQSLNILLAFPRLALARLRGTRTVNVHWVYMFHLAWAMNIPLVRRVPRWLFLSWLAWAQLWGLSVIYTWHDVVPLNPVFDDDRLSRRQMVRFLDGVITITAAARDAIVQEFNVPRDIITVVPEGGPIVIARPRGEARRHLGIAGDEVTIGAYGHIDPYKGVDVTAQSLIEISADYEFAVRILGHARQSELAETLSAQLATLAQGGHDVAWENRRFTDDELVEFLTGVDIVVIAFRYITNSATMRMACAYGKTVIVPDLPALRDTPRDAVVWYDPHRADGLRDALADVVANWPAGAAHRADAARAWANDWTWSQVGAVTADAYRRAR
jgi:glycosyltransferase involved in cell wall biosynthesis